MTATLAPGSLEWLGLVTASKVAPILGLSPFTDQFTMWHRMAGNLPEQAETEAMRRGKLYEAALLEDFYGRHPELQRIPGFGTFRANQWLAVTPDSVAEVADGTRILVEAKTAARWDGWGENGTDEVPDHYQAQAIVCAHVLGCRWIIFPVMGPFWDYREYHVQPDPEVAAAVLEMCHQFWVSVQDRVEPPLSATVASYTTWTKVADPAGVGEVEIPPDLARRYLIAVAGEKDVKPAKALIANHLNRTGAKHAVCQGWKIAARQKSKDGTSLVVARKPPHPDELKDNHEQ